MNEHPLAVGDTVRHINQEWARSGIATAVVHSVHGPYADGTYEYIVTAAGEFARMPSADNMLVRRTQWSSRATELVENPVNLESLVRVDAAE